MRKPNPRLSFYDHGRQDYAEAVPPSEAGEFMVGAYGEPGEDEGVHEGGEFKIVLHDHRSHGAKGLTPQLLVFGDALGSLQEFLRIGGGALIEVDHADTDAFSRAIMALGLEDRSDTPLDA